MPLSLGPLRNTKDNKGKECFVVDIIVSPVTINEVQKDKTKEKRQILYNLCLEYIEDKYKLILSKRLKFPRMLYKYENEDEKQTTKQWIKKRKPEASIQEVSADRPEDSSGKSKVDNIFNSKSNESSPSNGKEKSSEDADSIKISEAKCDMVEGFRIVESTTTQTKIKVIRKCSCLFGQQGLHLKQRKIFEDNVIVDPKKYETLAFQSVVFSNEELQVAEALPAELKICLEFQMIAAREKITLSNTPFKVEITTSQNESNCEEDCTDDICGSTTLLIHQLFCESCISRMEDQSTQRVFSFYLPFQPDKDAIVANLRQGDAEVGRVTTVTFEVCIVVRDSFPRMRNLVFDRSHLAKYNNLRTLEPDVGSKQWRVAQSLRSEEPSKKTKAVGSAISKKQNGINVKENEGETDEDEFDEDRFHKADFMSQGLLEQRKSYQSDEKGKDDPLKAQQQRTLEKAREELKKENMSGNHRNNGLRASDFVKLF